MLNPIHGHGDATKEGRQSKPEGFRLKNRKVSKCQAADHSERPVAFGVTLLSIHNDAKILRFTKLPKQNFTTTCVRPKIARTDCPNQYPQYLMLTPFPTQAAPPAQEN